MKVRTSFLTRCVAMVMALLMTISGVNLGAVLQVYAAENVITVGALMAENYNLSEAEAALLASGYLAGSEKKAAEYDNLPGGLVNVDKDTTTITAESKNGWVPTTGVITYGANTKNIDLSSGSYYYGADNLGNAFNVKVNYKYETNVSVQDQSAILAIIPALKQGIANLDAVAAQFGNLVILEEAMPEMVSLINKGVQTNFGGSLSFAPAVKDAVAELNAQMTGNGGKLNLSVMVEQYENGSKTAYLKNYGDTMQGEVEYILAKVETILNAFETMSITVDTMVQSGYVTQTEADQLKMLTGVCRNLVNGLTAVVADPWTVANNPALLNSGDKVLDALVAALGTATEITPVATLLVDEASQSFNMSMFNVTVEVILNTTQDNEVKEYGKKEATITLTDGAKQSEIVGAINENGIEAAAIAAWGDNYVAEKFDREATTLPETLNADVTYTITYSPKNFTVTIADEDPVEYPYGYKLILPVHEDAEKAYDYKVNDVDYAQGDEVEVTEDLVITRTEGKSYTSSNLYQIVANNFMEKDSKGYGILTSGALNDNEAVNVRYPGAEDAATLLQLLDGNLTAASYDSSYNGLAWVPYTYGINGDENTFSGNIAAWGEKEAKVIYRLGLTNYTAADVAAILGNIDVLVEEADAQVATLNILADYHATMGQLDKTKLGALNGVIDVTDFTQGDNNENDAKNLELRAYFKEVVSAIIADNLDSNNYLKIYNMLGAYLAEGTGGLRYYYNNSEALISEINMLSEYLGKMTAEEEALRIMVSAAGFPEYVEKITGLEEKITLVKNTLTPPNALINLDSNNLGNLITALEAEGEVAYAKASSPWLDSVALTAMDESQRSITITVNVPSQSISFAKTTEAMDRGTVITAEIVNGLKAAVNTDPNFTIDTALYELAITDKNGVPVQDVSALIGTELVENVFIYYTYTAKQFDVVIPGIENDSVSVENKEIILPTSTNAAIEFTYILKDSEDNVLREISKGGTITLNDAEFALAMAGKLVIEKRETDLAVDALEQLVAALNTAAGAKVANLVKGDDGQYTGITVNADMKQMMAVVMELAQNAQYTYVGLNGEGFKYLNAENSLEVSIQTLINAIIMDKDFSNDAVIDLCDGSKEPAKLFKASLQLGQAADNLIYSDMDFVVNVSGVPEQITSRVDLIKTASKFIQFYSEDGTLMVEVTLPDKVYGAYAAALYATGNVDKSDANGTDNAVALAFLNDYLSVITGSEMDLETFENTLRMMGVEKDIDQYNNYYTKGMEFYKNSVTLTVNGDEATMDIAAAGKTVIDALMQVSGYDVNSTVLGMLKEYKDGATIDLSAFATLKNTDKTYYALIADIQADGVTNKFEAPSTYAALAAKTQKLSGYSAMILLDDVTGSLTISGTTVLDLNGKDINGDIKATGTLIIIDSSMDTYNAGTVTGSVSGNVTILGGNYNANVDAFLMNGYYKDGTAVRNALYYITDKDNTVTFVINGDVYEDENVDGIIPDVKALAIDIAADLLLNYAMSGKLSVGGHELVGINIEDLVGLYAGKDRVNTLANKLLDCVFIGEEGYDNEIGFEAVVNMILEDLLDFANISDALNPETPNNALATYAITTEPWNIEIKHITDGNYATVDFTTNPDKAKSFNVALAIESKYNEQLSALAGELANIVVADETFAEVDIPKPTYANKTLTVKGFGQANAVVDMSENEAYPVMIAVILANGNSAKREAVAAAINAEGGVNMAALKEVIDKTTVAEIFTALKVMNRGESIADMAAKFGVNVDDSVAELEAIYHDVLCGVGKALEKLEITGMSSKLGNFYNKETGYYELLKEDIFRDKELSARGYTALVELEATELLLKVKLFGEVEEEPDCLWGDADHDGDVDNHDASLVFEYYMNEGNIDQDFCLIRTDVDQDGDIDNHDASIIFEYYMEEKTDELPEGPKN